MSGPVFCAWNLTVPEPTHTRSQFPSDPNSLTLVGNKTVEGILLLDQKPICDDGWDIEAAHVACRQLGFSRAFQATQTNQANCDEFSLDDVKCRGNESSLLDCWTATTKRRRTATAARQQAWSAIQEVVQGPRKRGKKSSHKFWQNRHKS